MIINLCGGSGGGSSAPIKLQGLIARENGTYTPDEGYDGYSEVLVDVTEPVEVFVVPDGMKFYSSRNTEFPILDLSLQTSGTTRMFYDCKKTQEITIVNLPEEYDASEMFRECQQLKRINITDWKTITKCDSLFNNCYQMLEIPNGFSLGTSTDMSAIFAYCSSLKSLPILDTSNVLKVNSAFRECTSLTEIPLYDFGNVSNINYCFEDCSNITTLPPFNTRNVRDCYNFVNKCSNLQSLPLLDFGSVNRTNNLLGGYTFKNLTDLGGFKDLKTSVTSNFLNLCPNLTVESLMNVINNLWDWTDYPDGNAPLNDGTIHNFGTSHSLKFGSTNLNKLTEEQIAVATAKGWTLTA